MIIYKGRFKRRAFLEPDFIRIKVDPNQQKYACWFRGRTTLYNRPFHGLWRHLGWGANTAKITVNVWDFGPLGTAITLLQRGGFPQRKCILKDIYTEINFMLYKKEIRVITTVNEFLRFCTNPSNQHYANYHEIKRYIGKFKIRIYGRRTFFNSLIFCWMNDINKTI